MPAAGDTSETIRRAPGRRAGLSTAQIVTVARTIAPEALSMQAVARRLGVEPKALNHHVSDRATLLGLVAEEEFALRFSAVEISRHGDWREAVRSFTIGFTEAVIVTGAYAQHLQPHHALSTRFLDMNEAVLAKLVDAGFSDAAAVRAIVMLTSLAYAHARDLATARADGDRKRSAMLRESLARQVPGNYPNLDRIAATATNTYGEAQLDFGIETCIAGLAAELAKSKAQR